MSNDTVDAILDNCRAKLAGAPDQLIKLELYNTVDEVAREAIRTDAPVDVDADPATWLASGYWVPCYQVLLHGTLYRMYTQVSKPWANPDLGKVHFDLYTTYLGLTRSEFAVDDIGNSYERLLAAIHSHIPLVRDDAIDLELFGVANRIRLDAYGEDAIDDTSNTPFELWLDEDQWTEAYQAAYHGVLGRLYSQVAQPWANPEAAQQHTASFLAEIDQLRSILQDAPATAYARLVAAIKVQLPFVREEAIKLELFNTVNKVRLEAYLTTALAGTETNPTTWLTVAQYGEAYPALFHGTLARLYSQPSKPWADGAAYEIHNNQYAAELDLIRGTTHAE